MPKENRIRLGDLLLQVFALSIDTLGEIDTILTNPYRYSAGLPYAEGSVESSVRRLVRVGYLLRDGRGKHASYHLTTRGQQRIRKRMGEVYATTRSWDGMWRLVVFDIEEAERRIRDRLRFFLKSIHFGQLQKSIWITPYPVEEVLEKYLQESRLSQAVVVVEAKTISGFGDHDLAEKVWKLSSLQQRYHEFSSRCREVVRADQKLKETFERLILDDPCLPDELVPENFGRKQVILSYNSLLERESSL